MKRNIGPCARSATEFSISRIRRLNEITAAITTGNKGGRSLKMSIKYTNCYKCGKRLAYKKARLEIVGPKQIKHVCEKCAGGLDGKETKRV